MRFEKWLKDIGVNFLGYDLKKPLNYGEEVMMLRRL